VENPSVFVLAHWADSARKGAKGGKKADKEFWLQFSEFPVACIVSHPPLQAASRISASPSFVVSGGMNIPGQFLPR
jgi:hypothetical protein